MVRKALLLSAAMLAVAMCPSTAMAAQGDLVGQVQFDRTCANSLTLGVGIAFDGENLWYSCWRTGANPDLFRADPVTGHVTATYNIAGGLGALAFDRVHQILWAGWGGDNGGNIYKIQIDRATKTVTSSAIAFNAAHTNINDIDDGLAYDHADNTLYISADTSTVIHHYATDGTHLTDGPNSTGDFGWIGTSCYNSGLAIGGDLLYEGSDGCIHIWVVNKTSPSTKAFDFASPGTRDEDLECDPETFAGVGRHVMWSKDAYTPVAYAFEIPFNSCGFGGLQIRHDTSTTYTSVTTVQYSDSAALSASIRDTSTTPDTPLGGRNVTFALGNQSVTVFSDANGIATAALVVNQQPGSVTKIDTSIPADPNHKSSSDSDPFVISREDCTLTYSGDTIVAPRTAANLAADMGEPDGSLGDRSNKTITFKLVDGKGAEQTVTATTDSNGHAATSAAQPPGTYRVTVSFAGDAFYSPCQTSAETSMTVRGFPPDCSKATVSPAVLSPSDHKPRLVTIAGVPDPDGDPVAIVIGDVTQDETTNSNGDGDTAPDAARTARPDRVWLRAERLGGGDGRVYRISFVASDGTGESCSGTVKVRVDKSSAKAAVDSAPPSYSSFSG